MSIDLGIDNLATIVTNTGRRPVLVKGKNVKSINQYYNKLKAHYLGILRQGKQTKRRSFYVQTDWKDYIKKDILKSKIFFIKPVIKS